MNTEKFNKIIHEQIERCENTLCQKADEYATEDRLHNFKVAAEIQKHDMCADRHRQRQHGDNQTQFFPRCFLGFSF